MATLYVEFTQVHNIDLSEIAQFVKAAIRTSRCHSLGFNFALWSVTFECEGVL